MPESRTFKVKFLKAGATIEIPEKGIILDYALDAGVPLEYGCRAGACGTCKLPLVEGQVSQFGQAVDGKDGCMIKLCSSRPLSDVSIDG